MRWAGAQTAVRERLRKDVRSWVTPGLLTPKAARVCVCVAGGLPLAFPQAQRLQDNQPAGFPEPLLQESHLQTGFRKCSTAGNLMVESPRCPDRAWVEANVTDR